MVGPIPARLWPRKTERAEHDNVSGTEALRQKLESVFLSRTAKRLKAWGLQAKSKPYAESEQVPRAFDTNKMIACQFFNKIWKSRSCDFYYFANS